MWYSLFGIRHKLSPAAQQVSGPAPTQGLTLVDFRLDVSTLCGHIVRCHHTVSVKKTEQVELRS